VDPPTDPDAERGELLGRLRGERERVAQQVAALTRTFDEIVAAADLEPPDDEHDPDGTTAYERAQVVSLAEAGRRHLEDLDRAIAGVADGSYGTCERCGGAIGTARLEALPGARRCVTCAASGPTGRSTAP
jgi:RNA polymerase-binding transcription factor DksA